MKVVLNEMVVFDEDDSAIIVQNQRIELKQKERDLLGFLVFNKEKNISKDELLENVWGTTHRTDSTIKKTIFTLREKLGDNASQPTFIKTVDRVGYRFIASVTEFIENIEGVKTPDVENKNKLFRKRFTKARIAAAVAIGLSMTGLSIGLDYHIKQKEAQIIDANKRYLEKVDVPSTAVMSGLQSPDNKLIAYTEMTGSDFEQTIYIYNLDTMKEVFKLEDAAYPAWSRDSSKLAYIDASDGDCVFNYLILETKTIHRLNSCGDAKALPSVEWDSDGQHLFQFFSKSSSPFRLFRTNINTGKSEEIYKSDQVGFGIYLGHLSHKGDSLYLLENVDWTKTNVLLLDKTSLSSEVLFDLPYTLEEFAVVEDGILFSNREWGVDKYTLSTNQITPYLSSQTIKLQDVRSSNSNNTLVIGGFYFFLELIKFNSDFSHQLITSESYDKYPLFKNNKLYFFSERSNVTQVYAVVDGRIHRITNLNKKLSVRSYDIDKDENLVIGATDGIYFNEKKLLNKGVSVHLHDDWIYFSLDDGTGHQIFRFNIVTSEKEKVTKNGGFSAKFINDDLYVTKLNRKGLWKIVDGTEVLVSPDFPNVASAMSWFSQNNKIYAAMREDLSLHVLDIESGKIEVHKGVMKGSTIAGDLESIIGVQRVSGKSEIYKIVNPSQ